MIIAIATMVGIAAISGLIAAVVVFASKARSPQHSTGTTDTADAGWMFVHPGHIFDSNSSNGAETVPGDVGGADCGTGGTVDCGDGGGGGCDCG